MKFNLFLSAFLFPLALLFLISSPVNTHAQPPQARNVDRVLASINGQLITEKDLRYWLFQTRTNNPALRSLPDERIISKVLKEAVKEELLYQTLWSGEFTATDEDVKELLEVSYQSIIEQYQTEDRLREELRTWLLNPSELRQWLEIRVRRDWVIQSAIADQVPQQDMAEAMAKVDPDLDQYRLREIWLEVLPSGRGSEPNENDWDRTEYLMNSIRIDIAEGLSFADAAEIHSHSPSASDGGNLGWVKYSDLSPEIAAALNNLTPGQTTLPVRMNDGFGLYKLDGKLTSLSVLQREIRESLRQQALERGIVDAELQLHPEHESMTFLSR